MVSVVDLERVYGFEVERLRKLPANVVLDGLGLAGVAWRDVARVVGVGVSTVSGWLSGVVSPSVEEWERLLGFAACVEVLSGPTCDVGEGCGSCSHYHYHCFEDCDDCCSGS